MTQEPTKKRMGRPHTYDAAKVARVLELYGQGMLLKPACVQVGIKPGTFFGWKADNIKGLSDQLARAKDAHVAGLFADALQIADDANSDMIIRYSPRRKINVEAPDYELVQRSKLRVDTRMRIAEMYMKGIIGDVKKDEDETKPGAEAMKLLDAAMKRKRETPEPVA